MLFVASPVWAARVYGGLYTSQKLANVRANCAKYDWAKKIRDDAIKAAEPWLSINDDELWRMVPGQDLPRCIDVTMDRSKPGVTTRVGCLKCSDKIFPFGNYPYEPDFKNKPWKITCPSCGAVFPTNDFGKFYVSGIDETGVFNPSRADRSLLFNTDHPDPKDPLHMYGVDDGNGFVDADGHAHRFIGYYTWKYWRRIFTGLNALSDAFLYTGDIRYSHKAAILLDRIADVYPSMDWKPYARRGWYHSDGGRIAGKIEGAIWETGVVSNFARDYDKILSGTIDDAELFQFLKQQTDRYKLPAKGSRDLFVQNVDMNILQCGHDAIISGDISGNEGMHQRAMIACALALDTQPQTNQWLDWLFEPTGGAIPGLILAHLDRDGTSDEGAPNYAFFFGQLIGQLGSDLADYPKYTGHNILAEFPQFKTTYTAAWRLTALGLSAPNQGDSGATGLLTKTGLNVDFIAQGFKLTKDPALAVAAYRANGNSVEGLGRDLSSAEPDALWKQIEVIAQSSGKKTFDSDLMSGYGLAMLQSGDAKTGAAVPINFGRTFHHAHIDNLNFDLLAFGHWLMPDHGYPEYGTSWPSRDEWTMNTISHNTVVVDGRPQARDVWSGRTKLFKQLPGLAVATISSPSVYPNLKQYQRTMLLVDVPGSNHYVVDIFNVEGGSDHLYSLHGPPGEIAVEKLNLIAQTKGSYAGEDVAPEAHIKGARMGYSYLFNVRRDSSPPAGFQLDWKAAAGYRGISQNDDIHVRLHALTQCDDVALADGKPPQTKVGNPKLLGYALLHRAGKDLRSRFVSVVEPYQSTPFVQSVRREDRADGATTIVVALGEGLRDEIVVGGTEPDRVSFVRRTQEHPQRAYLIAGSKLDAGEVHLESPPALTGRVVKMNRDLQGGGWIVVDADLPADGSLVGQHIMIDNTNERDACYAISAVEKVDGGTKISCGPISFVRGFAGPTINVRNQVVAKDYSQG
jgi:hypothetical protein